MDTTEEEFSMNLPELNDTRNDMQVTKQGNREGRSIEVELIPPRSPQVSQK